MGYNYDFEGTTALVVRMQTLSTTVVALAASAYLSSTYFGSIHSNRHLNESLDVILDINIRERVKLKFGGRYSRRLKMI